MSVAALWARRSWPLTPAECAPEVAEALVAACAEHACHYERMVSRACHDSLFISPVAPTGHAVPPLAAAALSHRPDEDASPEDIARGALVLAVAQLAG